MAFFPGLKGPAALRIGNHVHLLLTPKKAEAVPGLIIALGRRYAQYINRSDRRTGPLRNNRYKSSPIQAGTCLLTTRNSGPARSPLVPYC